MSGDREGRKFPTILVENIADKYVEKAGKRIWRIGEKWITPGCPHYLGVIHKVIHKVIHALSRELFDNPPTLLLQPLYLIYINSSIKKEYLK